MGEFFQKLGENFRTPLVDQYADILKTQLNSLLGGSLGDTFDLAVQNIYGLIAQLSTWNGAKESASKLLDVEIFPYVFMLHCVFVTVRFRPVVRDQHWLFSLISTFAACAGGGTITSLLLQRTPLWLENNWMFASGALVWWLLCACPLPGDFFFRLATFGPVSLLVTGFEMLNRSRAILLAVDRASERYPGSLFSAIVIGTLAGGAGALIQNAVHKMVVGWNAAPLSEFSRPSWITRWSFYSTLAYVLLAAHPVGLGFALFAVEDVKLTLVLLSIAQGLLTELFFANVSAGPMYLPELFVSRLLGLTSRAHVLRPAPPASVAVAAPDPKKPQYSELKAAVSKRGSNKVSSEKKTS